MGHRAGCDEDPPLSSPGGGATAIRNSSAFYGSAGTGPAHDHPDDHLALIYDDPSEGLEAAVPFIKRGLDRGEWCVYLTSEHDSETVREALRNGGVDVGAALESGSLTLEAAESVYLEDGAFALDKALGFLEAAAEEAAEEFEGLRITAEESWLLDAAGDVEAFMELEARVNEIFDDKDAMALCQYNRDRFPPEILHDVLKTHPCLVIDDTVSKNAYYTPPEQFLGHEDVGEKVDRMMRTLREQTEANPDLKDHERYLRELYEITERSELSFEEKVERLLELGCERFDLRGGSLSHLREDGNFEQEVSIGPEIPDGPALIEVQPAEGAFCQEAINHVSPTAVRDTAKAGWENDDVFQQLGAATYFGIRVTGGTGPYGTFWFYDTDVRDEPFTEDEYTFLELMGRWISNELERREHETLLQECYEITSNPDYSFEETVTRLLEHGRDWYGFDVGYFSAANTEADTFEIVEAVGDHDRIQAGAEGVLSTSYCQHVIDEGGPMVVQDAIEEGWGNDSAYDTYGLDSFFGTTLELDGELYGTLCFGASTPCEESFTDFDHAFLDLLSELVSNELDRTERNRAQQQLYDIAADSGRSFEEKVDRLLDLGRERFDLEMGFFLEQEGDRFQVVRARGTDLEEGVATISANPGNYCKKTLSVERPVGVEDAAAAGWDDDPLYQEYDLGCYFGTTVTDRDETIGTVCFASDSARDREFTDAEYTFLDLIGQWLSHELEQERREAELKESKERLERVFESSQDAIYINDPHADEILAVNEAGCDLLGYTREEVLSKGPSDFHPNEMDTFRSFVDDVYEEGSGWTDELTCLHRDGEPIPVEMTASRIEYEGRTCLLAIVRDISERKSHERSQRRLYEIASDPERPFEAKVQSVLELGCERFDMEVGGIATVDPSTDQYTVEFITDEEGVSPGEQFPLSETCCRAVVEDGRMCSIPDTEREFQDDLCYQQFGIRSYLGAYLELEDGLDRTIWFVSTEPRPDGFTETERTFHHLMGQWVRYELERAQYEWDLETTVDQLQQSNDRLKQFAYAASHDLQEPLRMVSSYLQLLERQYKGDLDEDAQEYIDFAVDGADRMRTMVDDLLSFARVENADGEFEPLDADAHLDNVLADLQVQIAENDAEIVDDDLPTVNADSEQLEQLFSNLISNAIKYNESETPRVEITAERQGDHWEFAIADNGIGMDPDKTDRIFEVFKRLHHTDEYAGTGIGLSLCQEIVENHGGDIRVDSESGEGTTFYFTLPAVDRK